MSNTLISKGALAGDAPENLKTNETIKKISFELFMPKVLIVGETGTGKEVVARALHEKAFKGKQSRFLALNCSTFRSETSGSELFGHVKGAFTGADKQKPGLVDQLQVMGGTLFLDELHEMHQSVQPDLLRFLETGEYRAVGDVKDKTLKPEPLVIAAAQPHLINKIRPDLLNRISMLKLHTAPLGENSIKGIEAIVGQLMDRIVEERATSDESYIKLDKAADDILGRLDFAVIKQHDWSGGNVRDLYNYLQKCVITNDIALPKLEPLKRSAKDIIDDENDLPLFARILQDGKIRTEDEVVRSYVEYVKSIQEKWEPTKVREKLGISYNTLIETLDGTRNQGKRENRKKRREK
jgi:DNA-binding NtrC family response regulator